MTNEFCDEYYKFMFDNSLDAILLSSPDGSVYRANAAACEMFQMTEEEFCEAGRSGILDITDPRLESALKHRDMYGHVRVELTFIRKDGTTFPGELTSAIFNDIEGNAKTVVIIRDMSIFRQAQESLDKVQEENMYYANYDYLTGIFNRRALVDAIESQMEHAYMAKTPLCLLLMDLDNFKEINDRYGHECGDIILIEFTRFLRHNLRKNEILGRYGGDEFIVCLADTKYHDAINIGENLRLKIEKNKFRKEQIELNITVSIGVVCYDCTAGEDVNSLISRADKKLYQAKAFRNFVC